MIEKFVPVPYHPYSEKYLVSNLGRVKPSIKSKYSSLKGEFLNLNVGARGYAHVKLYYNGKFKQFFVHRMVALAFLGEPPENCNLVCHLDDIKTNNIVTNLMWGDPAENARQMVERGRSARGTKVNTSILTADKVLEVRHLYSLSKYTNKDLSTMFGVKESTIQAITSRRNWRHI